MAFFSSCNSVKYHAELLNYIDIPVSDIHGKQKQQRRTTTFFEFEADRGILLCTDVAARGLDIPAVDWIIQFDPPMILRSTFTGLDGPRVARRQWGVRSSSSSPRSSASLSTQRPQRFRSTSTSFPEEDRERAVAAGKLVEKNYYLHQSARDAYRSYILAYNSHTPRMSTTCNLCST